MSKKQSEYTIADILRLKPTWFMEKQSDQGASLALLASIHQMIDFGFNHIAPFPFRAAFGTFDISGLTMGDINKALHVYTPSTEKPSEGCLAPSVTKLGLIDRSTMLEALKTDNSQIHETIRNQKYSMDEAKKRIERIEEEMQGNLDSIRQYYGIINTSQTILESLEERLKKPSSIEAWKVKLLRDIPNQWIATKVDKDGFTLVRRTPITMKYSNAAGGMCKTLYLGFIGMHFDWDLHCRGSFPAADCIDLHPIHPHVSGGAICWGNVSHKADEYRKEHNTTKFFQLLETLLTTYNPESPYQAFHVYERAKNEKYCIISQFVTNTYADKRDALVREWAFTASEKFIENISMAFTPVKPRTKGEKVELTPEVFSKMCTERYHKFTRTSGFRGISAELPKTTGIRGPQLVKWLEKHGLKMPTKHMLERYLQDRESIPLHMMRLAVICYGPIRTLDGYYVEPDVTKHLPYLTSLVDVTRHLPYLTSLVDMTVRYRDVTHGGYASGSHGYSNRRSSSPSITSIPESWNEFLPMAGEEASVTEAMPSLPEPLW